MAFIEIIYTINMPQSQTFQIGKAEPGQVFQLFMNMAQGIAALVTIQSGIGLGTYSNTIKHYNNPTLHIYLL